ncbi:MAG: FKBP-type peptidyl-prolyl cis-trans isomerase [Saprospiraceae bacterium]|nr:FKBP-type peptidyl-prolyl cis-trans isomerase [Saprospiraceae bacterium]
MMQSIKLLAIAIFAVGLFACGEEKKASQVPETMGVTEANALVTEYIQKYNDGTLSGEIQTTNSGLKFVVLEEGTGAAPQKGETVNVNYFGALTNGSEFDNSFKRNQAFSFPLGQGRVIAGWDEGVALMKKGGTRIFFIPARLGYGERGYPPVIPGNSELVFLVQLLD